MMKLKSGVNMTGVRAEMLLGIMVASGMYDALGFDMTITSLLDGKHSATSLHYAGCAADLRIRDLPEGAAQKARDAIAAALPNDFDVVLESDHIHMEWQPRLRG